MSTEQNLMAGGMDYDALLSRGVREMRPSGIRRFFDLAAEMPHCISLGVGEPAFKTPWNIRDAAPLAGTNFKILRWPFLYCRHASL